MRRFLLVGSIAWDEVVELDAPLRVGSHNAGRWRGGRIGGGATNTAMALARAGEHVQVASAVGSDAAGRRLIDALTAAGVDTTMIDRAAPETTRSLVMLDAGGDRTVVNLARAPVPLPPPFANCEAAADWVYVRSADPTLTPVLGGRVASSELLGVILAVGGIDEEGATNLIKSVYEVPAEEPLPDELPLLFRFRFVSAMP